MNHNIVWHEHLVKKEDRQKIKGHGPKIIWFTGLSGSGKSTIASLLEKEFINKGIHTYLLDGDNVRQGLCKDLGFSDVDRKENIRRISEVARLMVDAGLVVLTCLVSPFREDRETARKLFQDTEFIEIFVDCDIETCEKRDPKGLYRMAREGKIKNFTGIDSLYERPDNPEIIIKSAEEDTFKAIQSILDYLKLSRL